LSDVKKAVLEVQDEIGVQLNSFTTVVDAMKCKLYEANFGEFFRNQVEHAKTIIVSRTDKAPNEKIEQSLAIIRKHNDKAPVITTPIAQLSGSGLLEVMEQTESFEERTEREAHHCGCGCDGHHHEHDHHEHHEGCGCGHHHEHEHHEHHEGCGCGHHHEHEHHEHHEGCGCGHHHEHDHHEHHEGCGCGHHHEHDHHHAEDVFTSWGVETICTYTKDELEKMLQTLDQEENLGTILRAKGMVKGEEHWFYFDYVSDEWEVRVGEPAYTGKLCVIGTNLDTEKLERLFQVTGK
jgi:G3E family GTPase